MPSDLTSFGATHTKTTSKKLHELCIRSCFPSPWCLRRCPPGLHRKYSLSSCAPGVRSGASAAVRAPHVTARPKKRCTSFLFPLFDCLASAVGTMAPVLLIIGCGFAAGERGSPGGSRQKPLRKRLHAFLEARTTWGRRFEAFIMFVIFVTVTQVSAKGGRRT